MGFLPHPAPKLYTFYPNPKFFTPPLLKNVTPNMEVVYPSPLPCPKLFNTYYMESRKPCTPLLYKNIPSFMDDPNSTFSISKTVIAIKFSTISANLNQKFENLVIKNFGNEFESTVKSNS